MNRRRFIAVVGTVATAGCTADSTSTDDPSTATETATATTARPTVTTARRTATETPPPETASTPTRAEELIERGRTHVLAAVEEFTRHTDTSDPSIVDVTAATVEFSRFDVNEEYRSAILRLEDAKKSASPEEASAADALVETAEFVQTLGFVQLHLVNAYEAVSETLRSFYTESYDNLPDDLDAVARQRDQASEYAATLRSSFDESTVAPIEAVSAEQFGAKLAQIDAELATFEGIVSNLRGLQPAIEAFEDDVSRYRTGRYDEVSFRVNGFEDVSEGIDSLTSAESLRSVVEELGCLFGALADGTAAMRDATYARQDDDPTGAREHEEDAEAAFRRCDRLVREVGPVAELVEAIPR